MIGVDSIFTVDMREQKSCISVKNLPKFEHLKLNFKIRINTPTFSTFSNLFLENYYFDQQIFILF